MPGRILNIFFLQVPEARCFYGFQIAIENIHSEMYSLLIDTYVKDSAEKSKLFNAIETVPAVGKKAKWALNWINADNASYAERIIAYASVEGKIFLTSFSSLHFIWHEKVRSTNHYNLCVLQASFSPGRLLPSSG